MVRSCWRQQMIDWHLNTWKTVFEADKRIQDFAWPAMTDEEKEAFLKKKEYRTKKEEKEFIRIWEIKYWIPWHATWFYSMCNHHRKPKKRTNFI